MARPSTATTASTISTTSAASAASTAVPSPASLLWAHQLKREHTYLAERFRQLESKNSKLEEALQESKDKQKELVLRLETRIDEIINANATALQANEAVRKEHNARTSELRDQVQLLGSTIEQHGRIQTEADVQRDKVMDGQIAILKRLAVFEQSTKGQADIVAKLTDDMQRLLTRDAFTQTQIDQMDAMAARDRDTTEKETQRMTRDLSEAMRSIQDLGARIGQINQSVVLLVQDNAEIKTKLAQQPVVTEITARPSSLSKMRTLDQTTTERPSLPCSNIAIHDPGNVDEGTVASSSPAQKTKADRSKPTKNASTSDKPQRKSRIGNASTKGVPASCTKQAPKGNGGRPQARANVPETASENTSKACGDETEVEPPECETTYHRPIAKKVKDKKTRALKSQAQPHKENSKSAQASARTANSIPNNRRGVKRKVEDLEIDPDLVGTLVKQDATMEQKGDRTRHLVEQEKAAPALRRSARTQQSQALLASNKNAKPSTTAVKPTGKKPTSGRDPTTGKFIKREAAKRLVRVSSEGSPTLVGEPEQSAETGKLKAWRDDNSARNSRKQPTATKRLAPASPNPRPAHTIKRTAPVSRNIHRDFLLPADKIAKRSTDFANLDPSKENSFPASFIPSSSPLLQSRRNPSELSTIIDRDDATEILVEDSLPKLPPPPPPPAPDVARAAKRRRIDSNLDDDIEELMRLKRELMAA
jgi:hypothetical protein